MKMREMRRICVVPKEQLEAGNAAVCSKEGGVGESGKVFFTECRNGNKKRWDRCGIYKTSLSDAW